MAATLLGGSVTGVDSYEHRPEDERLEDRIEVLNEYPYDFLLLRYHRGGRCVAGGGGVARDGDQCWRW